MQSEITLYDKIEEGGLQFEWRMKFLKGSAELPMGVSPALIENICAEMLFNIKSYFAELKRTIDEAAD